MLFLEKIGDDGPLIVMLHWLGGSSRSWRAVSVDLALRGFRCAAVDLPGFGAEACAAPEAPITDVLPRITETIRALRQGASSSRWILIGHSMGGKFATIVARMAEDGMAGLEDLAAVVLVSSSPPGPEPMSEKKRKGLVESLGRKDIEPEERRKNAEAFVDDNIGRLPLLPATRQDATEDVLRMNPDALVAWMVQGSKEDWSDRVGRLHTRALVIAGSDDEALGENAQRDQVVPHFDHATFVNLEGGGHLAPLERPAELADRVAEFCGNLGLVALPKSDELMPEFAELVGSELTSPQTRHVLLERLQEPSHADVFTVEELRTLRALAFRVVPDATFDLAARTDRALANPAHDGWRFDRLPPDQVAWKQGLSSLDLAAKRTFAVPFVALDSARQDELLKSAQKGELGKGLLGTMHIGDSDRAFDGDQMRDWFEDVRGELVKLYVADPRTMQRIGFTGFADQKGFTQIRLEDQKETAS